MALPDAWGSDYDYAEAHGNYDTPEREPEPDDAPADPRGRELTPTETAYALNELFARLQARLAEHATRRCTHGVNLDRARCATCAPLSPMELGR